MKRLICSLLILSMLMGCSQKVIGPMSTEKSSPAATIEPAPPTATPIPMPATPEPTDTPRPPLYTFGPPIEQGPLFPEEALSQDGEPIASLVYSLLEAEGLSKAAFMDRFLRIIARVDELEKSILDLTNRGRTLTAERKEKTSYALMELMSYEMQAHIQDAYSRCPGEGEDLPMVQYSASVGAVLQDVQWMEERTSPYFDLGSHVAKEYTTVLERFMGEPVVPLALFHALEDLLEAEAYAIGAALRADPEAARKRAPISFGSFEQNILFLSRIIEALCPLPNESNLPMPVVSEGREDMSLMELAFHYYPGMAFLKTYAVQTDAEQQTRWANAPDGYLAGLAVHGSYAVIPYLSEFGLEYVQYRWYEYMLDVTLTGMCALLIHYYGYSEQGLLEYLKSWGAEEYADYLYEKAMSDPFESLVASYGYWQYLDICQAALDAGCPTEQQFLQDYLNAGPAPYEQLKKYMVNLYQNQG